MKIITFRWSRHPHVMGKYLYVPFLEIERLSYAEGNQLLILIAMNWGNRLRWL